MARRVPIPSYAGHPRSNTFTIESGPADLTILDILRLRQFFLSKQLPNEMINIIFDEGEAWVRLSFGKNCRVVVNNVEGRWVKILKAEMNDGKMGRISSSEMTYLTTPPVPAYLEYAPRKLPFQLASPPALKLPAKVRRVKFTIVSRCQMFTMTSGDFSTKWPNLYIKAKISHYGTGTPGLRETVWRIPTEDLHSFNDCGEDVIIWDLDTSGKWGVGFVDFLAVNPLGRIGIVVGAAGRAEFIRYVYTAKIEVFMAI